jgi:hypothetical protein
MVRDRILMQQKKSFLMGKSRDLLKNVKDPSPLRDLFLSYKDQTIYDILIDYFINFKMIFWDKAHENSYIIKTVGVQAAFDILKLILIKANTYDLDFKSYLEKAANIDFSDKFFQASGIGRSRIRNAMSLAMGLIDIKRIRKNDFPYYEDLIAGKSSYKERWIWEEDAENALINALEKAEWNFDNKSVNLYLDSNYDSFTEFNTFKGFFAKLVEIAEIAFSSSLPSDKEIAQESLSKFDSEELVYSFLDHYSEDLKKMGWTKMS